MTPALLAPLGLAALAALLVPLLVHLRRRTEAVPVDFAALRWLDPRPRPKARVRFDEWVLLAVRLLLVALLALLLARPAVFGSEDRAARVLVVPGVSTAQVEAAAPASAGATRLWLTPGFPALDLFTPTGPVPLASLIRQYDAETPTGVPLTVVVPAVVGGLDAAPLRLTRRVAWRVVPGAPAADPTRATVPGLAVRHDPAQAGATRYLRAAAVAWGGRFEASGSDDVPTDRVAVWLKRASPPPVLTDAAARGGIALVGADSGWAPVGEPQVVWRDAAGQPLAEVVAVGRGRTVRLTRALTPAAFPALLEADFPERLRGLVTLPTSAPARARAADVAPVAGVLPYPLPPRDLGPWLALLIAVVFLTERWLAAGRRRGSAS